MAKKTSRKSGPWQEFGVRFTFPVYLEPRELKAVLENLKEAAASDEFDLLDEDFFIDTFGVGANKQGPTPFDKEIFGPQCVEVYYPDSPSEFQYPPAAIGDLPGLTLVITTKMPALNFVEEGMEKPPATPEKARECFLSDEDFQDLGAYYVAFKWEMGPTSSYDPDRHVQFVVDNRFLEPDDVGAIAEALESLAKKIGALDRAGVSTNPYSALYRPTANTEVELQ